MQGNAWLRQWADHEGVLVPDVEGAMRLRELAAHLERMGELTLRLTEGEQQLDELRAETRRATPSATPTTVLRERTEELDELREGIRTSETGAREEVARLLEIGHLSKNTRIRNLATEDLRAQATTLLPDDRDAAQQCEQLIAMLADWHARFGAGPAFRAAALLRSQVVAATCVGLGGIKGAESVPFDLCIVDEASRATATELLIPMALSKRIVLVGDDRQLPPFVDEAISRPAVLKQHRLSKDDITTSLFARLAHELPKDNVVELTKQHRMQPAIGRLVSECFYNGKLTSEPRELLTILEILAPRPVTWLTTSNCEDRFERRHGSSVANDLEDARRSARAASTRSGFS